MPGGGGGGARTLHSPLPHESQCLDWAGHPGDIKCPIKWEGSPALGVTLEFSAALNFAQETKGLKEGKGDVTRSRRGQRVEKSKAIVCLGPAQLEVVRKPITATSGQVPSFIEQGLKNLRGNYPD